MSMFKYILVTLLPWIELRGAIPLAVKNHEACMIPLILAVNIFIFFPVYFGLELLYEYIVGNSLAKRKLEKTRKRARPYVEKYGMVGLLLFVAIPLPGTGAYSGSAAAWLLDLDWRHSLLAVASGVAIAGVIVFLLSTGLVAGLGL